MPSHHIDALCTSELADELIERAKWTNGLDFVSNHKKDLLGSILLGGPSPKRMRVLYYYLFVLACTGAAAAGMLGYVLGARG